MVRIFFMCLGLWRSQVPPTTSKQIHQSENVDRSDQMAVLGAVGISRWHQTNQSHQWAKKTAQSGPRTFKQFVICERPPTAPDDFGGQVPKRSLINLVPLSGNRFSSLGTHGILSAIRPVKIPLALRRPKQRMDRRQKTSLNAAAAVSLAVERA